MAEDETASQHRYCLASLKHPCVQAGEGEGGWNTGGAPLHPSPNPQITNTTVTTAHLYLRHNGKDHDQFSQVHWSRLLHYV